MADGEIVKKVIIETEIRSAGGEGAAGERVAGGKRAAGIGAQGFELQKQALGELGRLQIQVHKQRINQLRAEGELIKKLMVGGGVTPPGMQPAGNPAAAAQNIVFKEATALNMVSKEGLRNIRLQVEQTLDLRRMEQKRHQENLNAIKAEAEHRIAMRRAAGEPVNIGGRQTRGGGFVQKDRVDYFSTGSKTLDAINRAGFQQFITVMSLQMGMQLGKGIVENVVGFLDKQGDTFAAQLRRFYDTGELKYGSMLEEFGLLGDRIWSLMGFDRQFDRQGMGGNSGLAAIDEQNRVIFEGITKQRDALRGVIQLWDQATDGALSAAKAEQEAAEKRLEQARQEFGMLSAFDMRQVLDIGQRFTTGGRVSTDEVRLLRSVIPDENKELSAAANRRAFRGGFGQLNEMFGLSREEIEARQKVAEAATVNIGGININLEVAQAQLEEVWRDSVATEIDRRLREAGVQVVAGRQRFEATAPAVSGF